MPPAPQPPALSTPIDDLLNRQPLMVAPGTPVVAVVQRLASLRSSSQAGARTSSAPPGYPPIRDQGEYALVVADGRVLGSFAAVEVIPLVAAGMDLATVTIADVMHQPVITLTSTPTLTVLTVLEAFQHHQVDCLPIVDAAETLVGLITQSAIHHYLGAATFFRDTEHQQKHTLGLAAQLTEAVQPLVQPPDRPARSGATGHQQAEEVLQSANHNLEEQIGRQAAKLVQSHAALHQETKERRWAQEQLTQFFTVNPSLMCVAGLDGYFKRLNPSFTRVLGYTDTELMAEPFLNFVHPDDRVATQAEVERLGQGELTIAFQNRYRCKNGEYCWLSWNATADLNEQIVYATANDVTEHKRVEQTLARQYQQDQLLGEITRRIHESLDIETILNTAVAEVRKLLDCDRVVIIEWTADNTGIVIQESIRADSSSPSLLHQAIANLRVVPNAQTQVPPVCACADLISAPCSICTSQFLGQWQTRSCVEVAIYASSQFWGLITASQSHCPRQWEPFEIELMQQLANQIGVAIAQAQLLNNLEAQVKQRTEQLSRTNRQLKREIQDRIHIENALRESQQKLARILESADEAIISINSQQQIVMYNQGAERIFGYTFDEVHNQSLDILLPEAFRQAHQQHVRNFSASDDTSRQMANRKRDVQGQRKTGETFPAEASISKLLTKTGPLFTVILKDITEQREAEAALLRSEERLRLTTNALPALIGYVDTEQRYRFNNQTYESWFHCPAADLKGQLISEVMGEAYYACAEPHVKAALAGRQVSFETELTPPDGQSRYVLTTYIPEIDDQGHTKGLFELTNDISDRKATERMKDEFVSVVGHELRTPLTSIHGSLMLLASQQLGSLTPEGQEFIDISLKNTQRLTRLINDVLDLERIESGQTTMALQMCNLAELMTQASQAMQAMAHNQGIQLQVDPLEATIWVDPDHLLQVLTNLLSNGIKFSSANTTIWLGAIRRHNDILVQVKDHGRGIPPDKLETVFERFQQVDASDSRRLGGTGLGLAICKKIVQQHGGTIWAESTLGAGSSFFFTVPDIQ